MAQEGLVVDGQLRQGVGDVGHRLISWFEWVDIDMWIDLDR